MGCDITAGRIEQCKDSVSGLKAMYLINYDDLNSDSTYVTYGAGDNIDEIIDWAPIDDAAQLNIYKFELKSTTNSFTTAINSSRDNGTTFFEQTLVAALKRQDVVTHKNVKLLAYGRPANFLLAESEAQLATLFASSAGDALINDGTV